MSDDVQYPDHFIDRLHKVWGEGFLSPGGPEEVRAIVSGLQLAGKTVLDVGFGTGGPAIALAREHDAARVVGLDIEPQLRDRASRNIDNAGIADRIELRVVEPGPFPLDDASFDVVFSKDSMIHIEDKAALFAEVLRVLKPGGVFVASDWLRGEDDAAMPALDRMRELAHLTFTMVTAAETGAALRQAGFEAVGTTDRNAWYKTLCAEELVRIEGPLKAELIELVGEETYAHWVKVRTALNDAVACGGLRPTHLRGFRPVA